MHDAHWCWFYPEFAEEFDKLALAEEEAGCRPSHLTPLDSKIVAAIESKIWQKHARSDPATALYYTQVERLTRIIARELEDLTPPERKDHFSEILRAFSDYRPQYTGRSWRGPSLDFAVLYNANAFWLSKNRACAEKVMAFIDEPTLSHHSKLKDLSEPMILLHWRAANMNVEEMLEAIVMTDIYELLQLAGFGDRSLS